MARLPADPEGFIRANTALEAPAMVPEFRLWLASEYVPIWQATETWLEEQKRAICSTIRPWLKAGA
jgi:predicted nicotinamide N-methyase